MATIAEYAGLTDSNLWNLANTVETNILQPLVDCGYICSFNKIGDDPKSRKYAIRRSAPDSNDKS